MAETNRRTFLSWLSRSGLALAAAGTTGAITATGSAAATTGGGVLVCTNATLIDGTGAPARPDSTIVVLGDRIVAVGRARTALPQGMRVLDLRGKFVLPGLWDAHAHTPDVPNAAELFTPLFVANGVTGVREMRGRPDLHALRRRIDAGEVVGPRMVIGSDLIDGVDPFVLPPPVIAGTPAQGRAAVRRAKRDGADFVKVFSMLRPEVLAAIADEAARVGLPYAGHVPDRVGSVVPAALGMRTQEHLYGLVIDTSSRRDELRAQIPAEPADEPGGFFGDVRELERQGLESYDPRRGAAVFAKLARAGTTLDPTFTGLRYFCFPKEDFPADDRVRYVPAWVREKWAMSFWEWTPQEIEEGRRRWENSLSFAAEATRAGVPVTAGTDCGYDIPYGFAGFSLHDELALLVRAGVSPMSAILSATRDAARAAGLGQVSGTVAPNKYADLLVLDADPLADIGNTTRVHAIISRGRLITRADRERMLADVEKAAEADGGRTRPSAATLSTCCLAIPRAHG